MAGKDSVNLTSMEDVRKFLASTINQLRKNQITAAQARVYSSLCNSLMKAVQGGNLDKRLKTLEDAVKNAE